MKFITMLLISLVSCAAFADVDSDRKKELHAASKACKAKGYETVGELDACWDKAYKRIYSGVVRRGEPYAEKHYSGLSKSQAEAKLIELKAEEKTAASGGFFSPTSKKVSKLAIYKEGWWIQTHIFGTGQGQGDPWFIECKKGAKTFNFVTRCPLGKGGAE